MRFGYAEAFGGQRRTGYETLLYDAMTGDETLFLRADQTEVAWKIVDPIRRAWDASNSTEPLEVPVYPSGSNGPEAASRLLERDERFWRPFSPSPSLPRKEAA